MKLSIVIVNYNVCYFLEQTLWSVYKSYTDFDYEIVVVDNNSVDGSLKMLQQKFPNVNIIANKENVGFAKANNQAIQLAKGEYVLLLNPDTIIQEDTLQTCINFMDVHSDAGGLGVKMYDGAGNFLPESKRGFPSPLAAFAKMSGLSKIFPSSKTFGQYHLTYLDKNKTHSVDVLSGAFMLLRKSVLEKVGLLDEDYFMYGEDIDLSFRIKEAGFKNYYLASTSIIHFKGESTKKGSLNYIKTFYDAMIIFCNKHITGTRGKALKFLLQTAIYLRAIIAVIQKIMTPFGAPIFDAVLIVANLYFLHIFWEQVVKISEHLIFPNTFFFINIPIYTLTWMALMWFFGVYEKNSKWKHLLVGLSAGTLMIAIMYAFFPDYLRTSRGVILFGYTLNIVTLSTCRWLMHFLKGTLHNFMSAEKRYIIISDEQEAESISEQLKSIQKYHQYVGFVSVRNGKKATHYLGSIENLEDILEAYHPNEILFSTEDLPMQFIIETMSKIKQPIVFRLISKNKTIISSISKNTTGEIYSFNINVSGNKSWLHKIRNWL